MFRLQDERQIERFIGICREWLTWAKEHDVDIQVRTDCRSKSVQITFASNGIFRTVEFTEEQFNEYTTETVFSVLEFWYENLMDEFPEEKLRIRKEKE